MLFIIVMLVYVSAEFRGPLPHPIPNYLLVRCLPCMLLLLIRVVQRLTTLS